MQPRKIISFLSLAPWPAMTLAADMIRVITPRGATIEILEEKPAGAGPFPAVVLGSGSSYPMHQPVLERTAQTLLSQGIAVFRFNWAYSIKDLEQGVQSKDRLAEIEDMNTVLNRARQTTTFQRDDQRASVEGLCVGRGAQ